MEFLVKSDAHPIIQSSRHVDFLATALGGLLYVLMGRVANPEPLTAEHEVVDSIADFGR